MSSAPAPPKPLKHQPKVVQRRSKEEREAIDRAESEKRQARATAAAAEEAALAERQRQKYGISTHQRTAAPESRYQGNPVTYRVGRGGRGGFMGSSFGTGSRIRVRDRQGGTSGDARNLTIAGAVSQPAAAGVAERPGPSDSGRKPRRSTAALSAREAGRGLGNVKSEADGGEYLGSSIEAKKEQAMYVYVSDDEGGQDVDYIQIDDDSDGDDPMYGSADEQERFLREGRRRRRLEYIPHRIERQEHKDRVVGVNTDASTAVQETSHQDDDDDDERAAARKRKGKGRMPIKPDPEGDGTETTVVDPTSDAGAVSDGDQESKNRLPDDNVTGAAAIEDSKADIVPKAHRKPAFRKPVYQTVEEELEADRAEAAMRLVQMEFGKVSVGDRQASTTTSGDAMDVEATVDSGPAQAGVNDNVTYLIQFPPILPDLHAPRIKGEDDDADMPMPAPSTGKAKKGAASATVKTEDGEDRANGLAPPSAGNARRPLLEAGHVGKLRVHASGKMSLDWGGTSFLMSPGMEARFLQTVMQVRLNDQDVELDLPPGTGSGDPSTTRDTLRDGKNGVNEDTKPKQRPSERAQELEGRGFKGSMTSFGQIRGKLVVTPDWKEVLG